MTRASRKILLVFVEGSSDETIIKAMLDSICSRINVKPEIIGGDYFSNNNIKSNGGTIVRDKVMHYLNTYKLKPKDILYVAFIVDADGMFISPNDYVVDQVPEGLKHYFNLDDEKVIVRTEEQINQKYNPWNRKKNKISPIISKSEIKINRQTINFGIYFNSFDLEHITVGEALPDEQKEISADDIVDEMEIQDIVELFISKKTSDDFLDSWDKLRSNPWKISSNVNCLIDIINNIESNL